MILVDVYVPSVDMTYDFQLNETITIDTIIEEISEMIGQKEHSVIVGDVSKLVLCDKTNKRILNKNVTLAEAGIITGNTLILV